MPVGKSSINRVSKAVKKTVEATTEPIVESVVVPVKPEKTVRKSRTIKKAETKQEKLAVCKIGDAMPIYLL